jgi:hypothetical protein
MLVEHAKTPRQAAKTAAAVLEDAIRNPEEGASVFGVQPFPFSTPEQEVIFDRWGEGDEIPVHIPQAMKGA